MTDADMDLLIDLHLSANRQGPGGDAQTRQAIALAGLGAGRDLRIADIGCGTGAATRVLADQLDARITAIDLLPAFLEQLNANIAGTAGQGRVRTLCRSMDDLPFMAGELDAIWSEGAIYNVGFAAGVQMWRPFLKPGGVLAVSEITWLTGDRPAELHRHWLGEYAEIDTAAAKMAVLEQSGYVPIGYFVLPEKCWLKNYYQPMQERFAAFLDRNGQSTGAKLIVQAEEREISLYHRYRDYFSYGFYIARKLPD